MGRLRIDSADLQRSRVIAPASLSYCKTMPCYAELRHVTPCYIVLRRATPYYTVVHCATPCYIVLRCTISRYTVLRDCYAQRGMLFLFSSRNKELLGFYEVFDEISIQVQPTNVCCEPEAGLIFYLNGNELVKTMLLIYYNENLNSSCTLSLQNPKTLMKLFHKCFKIQAFTRDIKFYLYLQRTFNRLLTVGDRGKSLVIRCRTNIVERQIRCVRRAAGSDTGR